MPTITDITRGSTYELPGSTPVMLCEALPIGQRQLHEAGHPSDTVLADVPVGSYACVLSCSIVQGGGSPRVVWSASRRVA